MMKHVKLLTVIIALLVVCTPIIIGSATVICNNTNSDSDKNYDTATDVTSVMGDNKNFASHGQIIFKDINKTDVSVDVLCRKTYEKLNNPSFSEAVLLQQCIDYKKIHTDEKVTMNISSFHFSIVAAACVDRDSSYFGEMRSLYDCVKDDDGFIRISELLIEAAKIGIYVTIIGQIDAAGTYHDGIYMPDEHFASYFESRLDEKCYGDLEEQTVKDYMTFKECKWTSYGDRSASDMMHTKVANVSDYIDYKGIEHKYGLYLSSTNLDGIDGNGYNGNNGYQTGAIISDHYELWNVTSNYLSIMKDNCEQEDIALFRNTIIKMNTEQFDKISSGDSRSIKETDKIVYLGSENDPVFKMMFSPFGGPNGSWSTDYNPYCMYITKLSKSEDYIEFIWSNAKYLSDTEVSLSLMEMVRDSFIKSNNTQDNLYLHLDGLDTSIFDDLKKYSGNYNINNNMGAYVHSKDVQLSYVENKERHYVSILNSLNIHYGSMFYQSNHILIIDETDATGQLFYSLFKEKTLIEGT